MVAQVSVTVIILIVGNEKQLKWRLVKMFVLYKDAERANCIRYEYDCDFWYIEDAFRPEDGEIDAFDNLHNALSAYKAFIEENKKRNNTEFCVFLQAEAYDEDGEIEFDVLINCYACYKKNGRNIVLDGINAKQKRED